jgi:nitrogen-specific signal transduction histidine kinase
MGIEAPLVTDGILIPWVVDETRGTIFIMAHSRREAFDQNDCRVMQLLADFAAMGVRHQKQQRKLLQKAASDAAAAMANDLAHKINNPLQCLTNVLYLAAQGHNGEQAKEVAIQASEDLTKLSVLVQHLLALPYRKLN